MYIILWEGKYCIGLNVTIIFCWLLLLSIICAELTEEQTKKLRSTVFSNDYLLKSTAAATGNIPQGLSPLDKDKSKYVAYANNIATYAAIIIMCTVGFNV